jgi:glycerol kinase
LNNTLEVISAAMRKLGFPQRRLPHWVLPTSAKTTLLWNKLSGKPYGNAIVWQDTRTIDICKELTEKGLSNEIQNLTGLPLPLTFRVQRSSG